MNEQIVKRTQRDAVAYMPKPASAGAGDLVIHEGAITTIIKRVALNVKGVSRFAGNTFIDNIAEIVRSKKMQDRSIVLKVNNGSLVIEMALYTVWGAALPKVAADVKTAVAQAITSMTDIPVCKINVNFRGMDEEPAAEHTAVEEQGE